MQQNNLFGNMSRVTRATNTLVQQSSAKNWIPSKGDEVILLNINNGIEAIVQFVDEPNLYKDHLYPIQCWCPKLNQMIREPLRNVKLRSAQKTDQ